MRSQFICMRAHTGQTRTGSTLGLALFSLRFGQWREHRTLRLLASNDKQKSHDTIRMKERMEWS